MTEQASKSQEFSPAQDSKAWFVYQIMLKFLESIPHWAYGACGTLMMFSIVAEEIGVKSYFNSLAEEAGKQTAYLSDIREEVENWRVEVNKWRSENNARDKQENEFKSEIKDVIKSVSLRIARMEQFDCDIADMSSKLKQPNYCDPTIRRLRGDKERTKP